MQKGISNIKKRNSKIYLLKVLTKSVFIFNKHNKKKLILGHANIDDLE